MSNEVIKETEENIENSSSVENKTNPKPSAETAAEDNNAAAAVKEKR